MDINKKTSMKVEVDNTKFVLNLSPHCTTADVAAMTLQMLSGLYDACPDDTKDMYAEYIIRLLPMCFVSDDVKKTILEDLVGRKRKKDVFNIISDWMKGAMSDEG